MQARGCSDYKCLQNVLGWPSPFLKIAMENGRQAKEARVGNELEPRGRRAVQQFSCESPVLTVRYEREDSCVR